MLGNNYGWDAEFSTKDLSGGRRAIDRGPRPQGSIDSVIGGLEFCDEAPFKR